MTDRAALLAAVCDRPDDDTPRLAYADWLDDHAGAVACPAGCNRGAVYTNALDSATGTAWVGYPGGAECRTCAGRGWVSDGLAERAEFIRVQVELARCECNKINRLRCCRQRLDREWDLFDRYKGLWFGGETWATLHCGAIVPTPPGGIASEVQAVVRRGFVEEVRCPLVAWVGGACPTCQGEGRVGQHYDPSSDTYRGGRRCPGCPTVQGGVVGIAAAVCGAHPVRVVMFPGVNPFALVDGSWCWVLDGATPDAGYNGYGLWPLGFYPSRGAALAALSAAAVRLGRERAGLATTGIG